MSVDLAIVGGGPAGLATAIAAAERGLRAIVVEARALPLDKPCGEGVMPAAVAALGAMGVDVPAWGRAPFIGIRYVDGDVVAEGRFPKELSEKIARNEALTEIARAYLQCAGMTLLGELSRVTGLSRPDAGRGNHALVNEGFAKRLSNGVYLLRDAG